MHWKQQQWLQTIATRVRWRVVLVSNTTARTVEQSVGCSCTSVTSTLLSSVHHQEPRKVYNLTHFKGIALTSIKQYMTTIYITNTRDSSTGIAPGTGSRSQLTNAVVLATAGREALSYHNTLVATAASQLLN